MDYIILKEFNNKLGVKLLQIYHPTNQILERSKNFYWNATQETPITITENRKDDYIVSNRLIQKRDDKNLIKRK